MLAVEIAEYLDSQITNLKYDEDGTSGNVFISAYPSAPDVVVGVYPTGGNPVEEYLEWDKPTFQIVVRGDRNPKTASDLSQSIFDILNDFWKGYLVDGGTYIWHISGVQSAPNYLGPDENGRHEYSLNFEVECKNSNRQYMDDAP
jgi:hypothetical protein